MTAAKDVRNQYMQVTVLIENTSDSELICEHGLSLLIEFAGKKILLDAGATEAFYDNALKMGVSLEDLDACVLSHGHYDHSGGFEAIFRRDEGVRLYAGKGVAETYLSGKGELHEISVPKNVLKHEQRFVLGEKPREIFEHVYLIPHNTPNLEEVGRRSKLYKMQGREILPDDFSHEQSLVFETEKGFVIFNSCSHGGVKNIIREVQEACRTEQIYAYVGGLHMMGKKDGREVCAFSDEELDELCEAVCKAGIQKIYTGHCTGKAGLEELQRRLGSKVRVLTTGKRFLL